MLKTLKQYKKHFETIPLAYMNYALDAAYEKVDYSKLTDDEVFEVVTNVAYLLTHETNMAVKEVITLGLAKITNGRKGW